MSGSKLNGAQSNFFDILRGGAAQLVLIGHIYSTANPGETLGLGDLGVVIFFIMSGFLISYSALLKRKRGGYGLADFIRDRSFRIFVPYIPVLIIIAVLDTLVFRYTASTTYLEHYNLKDFFATFVMLQQHPAGLFADQLLEQNQLKLATFSSARPWWTVANEWWLYISFGLLLFSSWARTRLVLYCILLMLASTVPVFNMVAGTGQGLSLIWFLMALFAWIHLSWGSVIQNYFRHWLNELIYPRVTVTLIMVFLVVLVLGRLMWISFFENGFQFVRPDFYDFNLYVLLVMMFLSVFLMLGAKGSNKRPFPIRFFANYSYSLYLIHYSLIYLLYSFDFLARDSFWSQVLTFVACNLAGILIYLLCERHYKSLQYRYETWRAIAKSRRVSL